MGPLDLDNLFSMKDRHARNIYHDQLYTKDRSEYKDRHSDLKYKDRHIDSLMKDRHTDLVSIKERALLQGSGSVSGSPGRIQENLSRDSGIGGVKDGLNTSGESENDIPKYITDINDCKNYARGRFLGKGGFARVHELIDLSNNSLYAGKIIHKSRITKPHHKDKITREIELHRNLLHKNVVQFMKNFEDSDNIYILLENCSKKSLVHVLKSRHVVTEPETRYYMDELVSGVEYIHSQNIIHRDLKLGNLFLTGSMGVKIGDFGLATRVGQEKKGTICGTPNYISPEVLNKEGHGFPADVWALGCVMYALLVGSPPFETLTLKETYTRIAENVYSIPESVSPSAAGLIRRLLHHNPRSRPSVSSIPQDTFFSSGLFPRSLPPSACSQTPSFSPEPYLNHHMDISNLTSSVHTLTLPNPNLSTHHNPMELRPIDVFKTPKPKLKTNTLSLYEALTGALQNMPSRSDSSLKPTKDTTVFISKWIDYSNKYGFGFQLTDRCIGVLFNDNTRISYSADRSYIQFGEGGSMSTMNSHQVPPGLHEKFTLLRYFAQYMDQNLTEGGETGRRLSRVQPATIPHIKRWVRTPKAIIMHLTNGTIQVNYFKDHTKLIVGGDKTHVVTYVSTDRQSNSFLLADLARRGAPAPVRERMSYVASVLEEFAELDQQICNENH
ncbi:serine/threonine-protein kinase PLK1 [Eurytemora carolleeae]|uniref:serine/threonine-protein kinase PLK1 n=1 Tax=Eurytemora carolleeae TaxID=1294199 RepID=UPI000C777600|nr:serine/threonine-protein kinase PLK1 [Eurytemora carolleeae]|eukprot:XP_023327473.1 serine/threonine-protein kinase PLK1-like [Eurytemora affinis]